MVEETIYEAAMRAAEELRQARIAAWNAGCYAASHGLPCTAPYDDEALNVEYRKGYEAQSRLSQLEAKRPPAPSTTPATPP